nr:MAG TPA: hypothetical protein [Bacteriophage sp.]
MWLGKKRCDREGHTVFFCVQLQDSAIMGSSRRFGAGASAYCLHSPLLGTWRWISRIRRSAKILKPAFTK